MGVIDHEERLRRAFSRLRQFARYAVGRIVGSTSAKNGAYLQLREMDECRHFHRVELNALTQILLEKKIMTEVEWQKALGDECDHYEKSLRLMWPELKPMEDGGGFELSASQAQERMKREEWPQ